jgi:hypothetical protein
MRGDGNTMYVRYEHKHPAETGTIKRKMTVPKILSVFVGLFMASSPINLTHCLFALEFRQTGNR